ncbi:MULTISPECIES: HPF/RaiA family ribosome-associated protein [Cyanophyceae]|uniref:DNA-binding protein n=1 Tax=Nodularia spumigena CENA596 TaxID=1819295 RepID=A0A166L2J3_NODSP|nr:MULTISPECIES: HPF/RaiA family ribosome-associated protein [Cyanophyceae]MDB9355590.1 HPF/RaiA family ribosome-associated protein [Nodularia spumigena CS-587/03]KZL51832.1 DNA-binding protein [Nodularia spumigena CENA596]MDB9305110.1 HPF/RaiA family ribosome-associated protein [Nodularia spumigena CS-591/12]MDB9316931.1 HPF/RaiA family ribosome-associated protein [Nodularia spumigena CS-590/01A]MDB9322776.1 HPF/RaiA family ribosome-associated protein [Nodularia spumigena CS-591/07A]
MKVPPEITYRNVEKTNAIDNLVHEKIAKLENVCDHISSCHISIEKIHDRPRSGSPYRVRIDMTVPPGHELVAERNPAESNQYDPLDAVIRDAFNAARQQLVKLNERQHESERAQNQEQAEETTALVTKLFKDRGYGFLRTLEGREIYFHRNSVLHHDFERLEIGTAVHFALEMGEEGPQASTVKIVDKPGVRAGKSEQTLIEPPLEWRE